MVKIDFDILDDLLVAGCDGVQCAAFFGCHPETLYDRVKDIKKTDFSDYKAQKRAKGDAEILTAQYDAAVKEKDRGMLIWLGKQRLGQKDKQEIDQTVNLPNINLIMPEGE
jgi:hypothetical protein